MVEVVSKGVVGGQRHPAVDVQVLIGTGVPEPGLVRVDVLLVQALDRDLV